MSSPVHSAGYLRYVMAMMFVVTVVSLMDRYVVSILMQQIKVDLELSDTQLGWLIGPAFVIVHVASQLPLARWADRGVRRDIIAGAVLLWSLLTMAAGAARTFPQLLLARMGVGISEAASAPAAASMLSDYFPPERRARAMSMLVLGGTAGIGAGMLLGGFVGQAYGWRVALVAAGLPGIALALLFRLTIREPVRGGSEPLHSSETPQKPRVVPLREVVRYLASIGSFRWMVVGASLSMITSMGRGLWEPVFLIRIYELDQATAGLAFFLIGPLPSMLGAWLGGTAADRYGRRDARWYMWIPAIAIFATIPLMTAFLVWPETQRLAGFLPVGFLFSIVGSAVGGMAMPSAIATAQSLAPPSMRAITHAAWTMAANLVGMGLGPLLAGWLSDRLAPDYGVESIRWALVGISALPILAALAFALAARTVREDLDRARGASPPA